MRQHVLVVILVASALLAALGLAAAPLLMHPRVRSRGSEHAVPTRIPDATEAAVIAAQLRSLLGAAWTVRVEDDLQVKATCIGSNMLCGYWCEIDIKKVDLGDETRPKRRDGIWLWYLYSTQHPRGPYRWAWPDGTGLASLEGEIGRVRSAVVRARSDGTEIRRPPFVPAPDVSEAGTDGR